MQLHALFHTVYPQTRSPVGLRRRDMRRRLMTITLFAEHRGAAGEKRRGRLCSRESCGNSVVCPRGRTSEFPIILRVSLGPKYRTVHYVPAILAQFKSDCENTKTNALLVRSRRCNRVGGAIYGSGRGVENTERKLKAKERE